MGQSTIFRQTYNICEMFGHFMTIYRSRLGIQSHGWRFSITIQQGQVQAFIVFHSDHCWIHRFSTTAVSSHHPLNIKDTPRPPDFSIGSIHVIFWDPILGLIWGKRWFNHLLLGVGLSWGSTLLWHSARVPRKGLRGNLRPQGSKTHFLYQFWWTIQFCTWFRDWRLSDILHLWRHLFLWLSVAESCICFLGQVCPCGLQ